MGRDYLDTNTRQRQIAETALRILSREGMKGLTVQKVSSELGIVPSAIYRHFRDKGAMVDAVICLVGEKLRENMNSVLSSGSSPREYLYMLLMGHTRFLMNELGLGVMFVTTEITREYPEKADGVIKNMEFFMSSVEKIFYSAREKGQIGFDLDPGVLRDIFAGLFMPAVISYHMGGGKFDLLERVEKNWNTFDQLLF